METILQLSPYFILAGIGALVYYLIFEKPNQ